MEYNPETGKLQKINKHKKEQNINFKYPNIDSADSLPKQKLKFQGSLEAYLEQEKVHDIFEDMMKSLIKDRPKNPIEFLIERLTAPESKLHKIFEKLKLNFIILLI